MNITEARSIIHEIVGTGKFDINSEIHQNEDKYSSDYFTAHFDIEVPLQTKVSIMITLDRMTFKHEDGNEFENVIDLTLFANGTIVTYRKFTDFLEDDYVWKTVRNAKKYYHDMKAVL